MAGRAACRRPRGGGRQPMEIPAFAGTTRLPPAAPLSVAAPLPVAAALPVGGGGPAILPSRRPREGGDLAEVRTRRGATTPPRRAL